MTTTTSGGGSGKDDEDSGGDTPTTKGSGNGNRADMGTKWVSMLSLSISFYLE
jgi:hypothetical protein